MLPWSKNVLGQIKPYIPRKMDPDDFKPSERSFPFCVTPMGQDEIPFIEVGEGYATFRMQRGPIKSSGVNGCQIDDIIKFCADVISVLNKKFPCRENSLAITKLEEAWLWCLSRKIDREARNVEGYDKD